MKGGREKGEHAFVDGDFPGMLIDRTGNEVVVVSAVTDCVEHSNRRYRKGVTRGAWHNPLKIGVHASVCMRLNECRDDFSPKATHAGMLRRRPDMDSGKVSMSFQSRDSTFRTAQQLGELFGRIVTLRRSGKLDDAMKLLKDGAVVIFGPLWDTLGRRESSSASILLGSRERVSAYAMFIQHEAEIDELRGDVWKGRDGFRRALELHLEAARLGSDVDAVTRSAIRSLKPRVDLDRLAKMYRIQLDRIVGPT